MEMDSSKPRSMQGGFSEADCGALTISGAGLARTLVLVRGILTEFLILVPHF